MSAARWNLKGLRRTTGLQSKGAILRMNQSAEDGEWSSPHYGGEGVWFHPIAPRCLWATRWGRGVGDPGRPGIVRAAGMAEIVRHPQTKGRETGKANIGLEPPGGRRGYKRERSSGRGGARSRIGARYSGTRLEQKASDRCFEQRRWRVQKARWRGKAPCFAESGESWEAVSRCWKVGEFLE